VNEVGGACGTHGRGEKIVLSFGGKVWRKETTGKIGSEWILGRLAWGLWLWLWFDCLRTRTGGGAVMNLRVLVPRS
jgi:hypothetical protein